MNDHRGEEPRRRGVSPEQVRSSPVEPPRDMQPELVSGPSSRKAKLIKSTSVALNFREQLHAG